MAVINAEVIIELLKIKHPLQEWAHFTELNQGTGGRMGRRIDFYAFNVWPSNGYNRIAYEVKITRNDFAKELADPTKRTFAEKVANECYFVVPVGLVAVEEVPEGWGLYEVVKNGLRRKKLAMQRKVEELPLSFVASMARQSSDENSKLPAAVWLLNGEEIGLDGLEKAMSDEQERIIRRKVQVEMNELERSSREAINEANVFRQLVREHVGWEYGNKPEAFEEWLKSKKVALPQHIQRRLRNLQRDIEALL